MSAADSPELPSQRSTEGSTRHLPRLTLPLPEAIHPRSPSDDNRPRGGTARTPGTRTPRRVQWAQAVDDDDVARAHRARDRGDDGMHSLDEAALDPEAFQTLAKALERARSEATASKASGAVPAHPQPAPTNYPHFPHTLPSLPEQPPVARLDDQQNQGDYFSQRRSSLAPPSQSTLNDDSVATETPEAFHRDQPLDWHGEVYVDPNERAGLPGPPPDSASSMVRAHTHRRRVFPSFPKIRLPKRKTPKLEPEAEKVQGPTDLEHTAARRSSSGTGMNVGGGILSALLALYDQDDHDHDDLSSGYSTPARHRSPARRIRSRSRSRNASREREATLSNDSPSSRSPTSKRFSLPDVSKLVNEVRPPKERNGAGVFGSLIATTAGAAAGPAAPATSTIVPNLKRPGYHLTRYSFEAAPQRATPPKRGDMRNSRSMQFEGQQPGSHDSPESFSPPYLLSPTDSITPLHPLTASKSHDGLPSSVSASASTSSQFPFHPPYHPTSSKHHSTSSLLGNAPSYKSKWSEVLSLPKRSLTGQLSQPTTPGSIRTLGTEEMDDEELWDHDKRGGRRRDREERDERKRAERKRRKKKAEIFITRHISDLIARQTFVLKLARAMMMFGGPTHRLTSQLQSTARVLEITLSCMYLPDTMLVSFDDDITSTSSVKLIKQGSALDLAKLTYAYKVYWAVIHDEMSVKDASTKLDDLMRTKPTYGSPALIFFGGMASAAICSVSFNGSLIDSLISFPLGCILVAVQIFSARHELYSNVFEITISCLISFVAAALAETHRLCYSAIASASVVLILPGYLVLCGSLELSSRNIISGSVRLCYALIYSLFLGFGLAIGAEVYTKIRGIKQVVGSEDYTCSASHDPSLWWRATPSMWWAFLTVPMFSLFLSLRNHAPAWRRELPLLVFVSCCGWVTNHFTGLAFPGQADISSAVGAFAVGIIANIYGRVWKGNAFVVMITGILFQLPSGLGNGGLLTFASQQTSGNSTAYLSGFQTALQLISTCIGLTVGLGISLVIIFPIQSRKRAGGVFSL